MMASCSKVFSSTVNMSKMSRLFGGLLCVLLSGFGRNIMPTPKSSAFCVPSCSNAGESLCVELRWRERA